jgi:hypothetical protein
MTDTATPCETFQASFTPEELDHLRGELTTDATQGFLKVWDLLLAKAGEPPHTQIPGRTIRPDGYSIPFEQAKSLVAAIEPGNVELHFAWVLAWLNYGPAWHTA